MTKNESYYRRVTGAAGLTMLLFLLFLNLFSISLVFAADLFYSVFYSTPATVVYQLYYAAGYMLSFMLPVLLFRHLIRTKKYPYRPMHMNELPSPWLLLLLPAAITVIFSAARLNATFVNIVSYVPLSNEPYFPGMNPSPEGFEWVLQVIALCVVPGFCEEFLFRGAIQTNLRPFGRVNAVLISSFLFSMMHQNPAQILYTFVAGIFLGIVYEKTNSLICCSVLHIFNNFMSTMQDMVYMGINEVFRSTIAAYIFETLLFVLGILSLAVLVIRFSKQDLVLREGIFEKSTSVADGYASHPISSAAARKYFMAPSMVIFLIFSVLQILFLLVITYVQGFF